MHEEDVRLGLFMCRVPLSKGGISIRLSDSGAELTVVVKKGVLLDPRTHSSSLDTWLEVIWDMLT